MAAETTDRKKLYVRLPAMLVDALEDLRAHESKAGGRRVSLRQLVERLLSAAVASRAKR